MLSFLRRDSQFMIALDWLAQLVIVNLHWLSVSAAFWLLLAMQSFLNVPQAIVLSPLLTLTAFALLLPATAAMFQDVRTWQGKKPLHWKTYWQSWRQNLRTQWVFNLIGAVLVTILPLYWRLLNNLVFARALMLGILVTGVAVALNRWVEGWSAPVNAWSIGRGLISAIVTLIVIGLTFQLQWGFIFILMGGSASAIVSYYLLERRDQA